MRSTLMSHVQIIFGANQTTSSFSSYFESRDWKPFCKKKCIREVRVMQLVSPWITSKQWRYGYSTSYNSSMLNWYTAETFHPQNILAWKMCPMNDVNSSSISYLNFMTSFSSWHTCYLCLNSSSVDSLIIIFEQYIYC
jgi:hypothetical protein